MINISWFFFSGFDAVVFTAVFDAGNNGISARICSATLKESVCFWVWVETLVLLHYRQVLGQLHLCEVLESWSCPHFCWEELDGISDGCDTVELHAGDVVAELCHQFRKNLQQWMQDMETSFLHLGKRGSFYVTQWLCIYSLPWTQDKKSQRITAGRTTFAKHCDIFKGNIGTCLKKQVYNSCVLPAMARKHGHSLARTRTSLQPHKRRWKEVC